MAKSNSQLCHVQLYDLGQVIYFLCLTESFPKVTFGIPDSKAPQSSPWVMVPFTLLHQSNLIPYRYLHLQASPTSLHPTPLPLPPKQTGDVFVVQIETEASLSFPYKRQGKANKL